MVSYTHSNVQSHYHQPQTDSSYSESIPYILCCICVCVTEWRKRFREKDCFSNTRIWKKIIQQYSPFLTANRQIFTECRCANTSDSAQSVKRTHKKFMEFCLVCWHRPLQDLLILSSSSVFSPKYLILCWNKQCLLGFLFIPASSNSVKSLSRQWRCYSKSEMKTIKSFKYNKLHSR